MKKLFATIFFLIWCWSALAQSSDQLKRLENERRLALEEIANTNKLLQNTNKTANNLLTRLQLLSNQINSRKKIVNLLEEEITGIDGEQLKTEEEIMKLSVILNESKARYAKAVKSIQANRQGQNKLLFILSGKSLSESYRRYHYLKEFSEWVGQQADIVKADKERLEEKETKLAKTKSEKITLLKQRENEHENLREEETTYKQESDEVAKKQTELKKVLAEKKAQSDALNKKIEKLIAEEIARQKAKEEKERLEREKAEKANKSKTAPKPKTSTSKPATPPSLNSATQSANIKLSSSFAANKGRLPIPISGNPTIVGRFGTQYHQRLKVSTSSNGIDLQSQSGASACAVFDGEVTRVISVPGYNYGVLIRHGDYFSFYANIQTVNVKQGDKVSTGQSIGAVYTDPETNASQIHFELWQGTKKLNPEPWLRK